MEAEGSIVMERGGMFFRDSFCHISFFQVSNTCSQDPHIVNLGPVPSTRINNICNQKPAVYPQNPDVSKQGTFLAGVDRQKGMDAAEALLIGPLRA